MRRTLSAPRPAFTLVELLVAMSIMILLAALVVGVSQSGMFGSQKVISAGDRASGWLLIAKQRAVRDGAPRGVRFLTQPGNATAFTDAQYIEAPDPWVPNPAQEANPSGARIVFVYNWQPNPTPPAGAGPFGGWVAREVYFYSQNPSDIAEFDQRVTQGDSLTLAEFGRAFQLTAPPSNTPSSNTYVGQVTPANALSAANSRLLTLASLPDMAAAGSRLASAGAPRPSTLVTFKFAFSRPPQPLLGEPGMQLTGGTAIDFRPPTTTAALGAAVDSRGYRTSAGGNPPPYYPPTTVGVTATADPANVGGLYFDILFSPSGQLLNTNAGLVVLWVRDASKGVAHPRLDAAGNCDSATQFDAAGQQVFVVVNGKNGLISTQEIVAPPAGANPTNYDAYQSAKDGINSGL